MEPVNKIEQELRDQLVKLHRDIKGEREAGANPNTIQKTMDRFLITWSGRLTEEQAARLADSRKQIEDAYPEIGAGATVLQEHDRALRVISDIESPAPSIKDHISRLRDEMIKGIQDIEKGRVPDFIIRIQQQMEKDQALADKKQALEDLVTQHQHAHDFEL